MDMIVHSVYQEKLVLLFNAHVGLWGVDASLFDSYCPRDHHGLDPRSHVQTNAGLHFFRSEAISKMLKCQTWLWAQKRHRSPGLAE